MAILNLEDQLVFYRSYHYNTINVLIHAIFVPTILFATLGLFNNIHIAGAPVGVLGSIGYAAFYLLLEFKAGLISVPILLGMSWKSADLIERSQGEFNKVLWGLFVLGWVVQFIGHGVFEKRAPALLDNLVQALVLAPFFVLFEGLFVVGYRHDLKLSIDKRVKRNIEDFKSHSKKK